MSLSDDQRLAMHTPQEIGKAIKKRRRELKITQKEFAKRLDKSERTKLATTTSSGGLILPLQRGYVTARPEGRYRKH